MANSMQSVIAGKLVEVPCDCLLQENGFKILTESGLSAITLESGAGGLTLHSSVSEAVSDYSTTITLFEPITLVTDLGNSQQSVLLPDANQVLSVGIANSSQTIRLTR